MTSSLFLLVFACVALAVFVWWLLMLIDALRTPSSVWESAEQNQLLYVLLMALVGVVGTIVYVAVARPRLRAVDVNA